MLSNRPCWRLIEELVPTDPGSCAQQPSPSTIHAALHRAAQENLSKYRSESQKCFAIEAICGDATEFDFPSEPTVLFLFDPFPEAGLRRVMGSLENSLREHPRKTYVLYHNALLERVLSERDVWKKILGTQQYALYGWAEIWIEKNHRSIS